MRYYVEWYERNRPWQVWFATEHDREEYIRNNIPCGVIMTTWESRPGT